MRTYGSENANIEYFGVAARSNANRVAGLVAVASLAMLQGGVYAQAPAQSRWSLTNTHAHTIGSATFVSNMAPAESVDIVIALKIRNPDVLKSHVTSLMTPADPGYRRWQSHEALVEDHAPTAEQVATVTDFLTRMGFSNVSPEAGGLTVRATGAAEVIRKAFNTELAHFRTETGRDAIANTKDVHVPTELANVVEAVLGLQTIDLMRPMTVQRINPMNWPRIYDAQQLPTASKTIVGVVTAGLMTQTVKDLNTFETMNAIAPVPVTVEYIGGTPTTNAGADAEWDMDTQNIVAMGGGQLAGLILYAGPSGFIFSGMFDSDMAAVIGQVVSENKAQVISVSLGICESIAHTDGTMAVVDNLFAMAVAQGQTFSVASGDRGSRMCGAAGANGTLGTVRGDSYPASSPYVVAVGGTTLSTGANGTSYSGEVGWSFGGGGPSLYEPMPSWQTGIVPGTMRGVPDISFDADFTSVPDSEVNYILDGAQTSNAGTSLAAPLFAGAWARLESAAGNHLGFAGAVLYARANSSGSLFHDITSGNNGDYSAGPGWDYVTGFGSLDVQKAYQQIVTPRWLPAVLELLFSP